MGRGSDRLTRLYSRSKLTIEQEGLMAKRKTKPAATNEAKPGDAPTTDAKKKAITSTHEVKPAKEKSSNLPKIDSGRFGRRI